VYVQKLLWKRSDRHREADEDPRVVTKVDVDVADEEDAVEMNRALLVAAVVSLPLRVSVLGHLVHSLHVLRLDAAERNIQRQNQSDGGNQLGDGTKLIFWVKLFVQPGAVHTNGFSPVCTI